MSSFILRLCALPTWPTSRTFCLHYRSHTHISFSLKIPHLGLPVSSRSRLCYLLILPVSHSSSVRPLDRPSPGAREHIHNACEMIGCGRDVTPPPRPSSGANGSDGHSRRVFSSPHGNGQALPVVLAFVPCIGIYVCSFWKAAPRFSLAAFLCISCAGELCSINIFPSGLANKTFSLKISAQFQKQSRSRCWADINVPLLFNSSSNK